MQSLDHPEFIYRPADFFARRSHYLDHILPIWEAVAEEERGTLYVPMALREYTEQKHIDGAMFLSAIVQTSIQCAPEGNTPLVVAAYGDMEIANRRSPGRGFLFMEHGVGLTFPHAGYAGGPGGIRNKVSMFLDPNEHTRLKNQKGYPGIPGVVIGTPKLDRWAGRKPRPMGKKPVVCLSFHWPGNAAPEAGTAAKHYMGGIGSWSGRNDFTLIGHAHPRYGDEVKEFFVRNNVQFVEDFEEVMELADLYINDSSSTAYEFLVTGKPVILLNCPQFRKNVHYGIRFWEYTDIGPQVENPRDLLGVIEDTLAVPERYAEQRAKAVSDLYPNLGKASQKAADVVIDYARQKSPRARKYTQVGGDTIGIVYMSFGPRAAVQCAKSMDSLRALGIVIPCAVVGDTPVRGAEFIRWRGQSPFDPEQSKNFQFRAGRVKPFLYDLSPFDRTMYIDVDTEFMSDPSPGFSLLSDYHMAVAEEKLKIGQLYNKKNAGWEINIIERDVTIQELGGDPMHPFLNSGVIFFKKCPQVKKLFEKWGHEWLRYQQWDEQLAFIRAISQTNGLEYKILTVDWNHPHRGEAKVIFHNYGRGDARWNVN